MSNQSDSIDRKSIQSSIDNFEKYGIKLVIGIPTNLDDESGCEVLGAIISHVKLLQRQLDLCDWRTWHAARCAMKSLSLHGCISEPAMDYFSVSMMRMETFYTDVIGMKLIDYYDIQYLNQCYAKIIQEISDPLDIAKAADLAFREAIQEYAEASQHNPTIDFKLRRETLMIMAYLGMSVLRAGIIKDH